MSRSDEFQYELVGRKRDGSEARFRIFKAGGNLRIVPSDGGEPTLVPRGRTLEGELKVVYGVVDIIDSGSHV